MSHDAPMAPVDVTWLRMDRPNNHMVIVGVIVLREPVDIDRVERTLEARLLVHDRFRRKIFCARGGAFHWREDARFDIGRHLRRARLPGAGAKKADLQEFVAELAARPLDPRHPLWQIHIVEGYEEGVALVLRIHHAIGDGAAMMRVLLDLTDADPDAPPPAVEAPEESEEEQAFRPPWEALAPLIDKVEGAARSAFDLAHNPLDARKWLREGANVAAELAWLLLMPTDTPTRLKGELCGDKAVAWSAPIPLTEVKAVGHALGCTVNDMLLSSFAGALKISYEPAVTLGLITALGYGPKIAQDRLFDLLLSRATAVMTNVPGPQRPLWLGGAPIDQIMFWVPQSGEIGMGVSLLSFNNRVQLGLITDAALVPDPDEIIKNFQPEFEQLLYHALLLCGEEAPPRPVAKKRKRKPVVLRVSGAESNPPAPKRRARAKEPV